MTKKSEKKSNNFNVNYDLLKKAMPFVLLLFVMWFAFFIRSGPISLNSLDERIESNTYIQIQSMISQQIDVQYPNLNAAYKQEMLQKEYQKILETGTYEFNGETIVIDDIVKQNTEVIKGAFKAENNQTYLNAIDPYHFYRLSNDVLINGHEGDMLKENANGEMQPFDSQKLAPQGAFRAQNPEFHIWLESKLFKLNNIDENSTVGEKTKVIFLIPVIFAMLCVIPTYFIVRKFSNDLFAFFGSLLLVSVGTFVSRTIAGFVDTDAYNVFFPLMVMMFLIYAFASKNKILSIILTLFAGLFMGMFIWAWNSGWFIFVFSTVALLGYAVYILIINFINKEKDYKNSINTLITFAIFAISSYVFTLILKGTNIFTHSYNNLFGSIGGIAAISQTNIWPNVLSSVAELNAASFGQIVSAVGGKIVFIIALLGLLFLSLDFEKKKEDKFTFYNKLLSILGIIWFVSIIVGNSFVSLTANHQLTFIVLLFLPVGVGLLFSLINKNINPKIFLLMILTVWMAGTIYMTLNGVRFVLLLAPAFATAFGFGLYYISKIVNTFFAEEFEIKSDFGKVVTGFVLTSILFLVLFVPMYTNAKVISEGTMPNFDDAWYSTMYKIRDNSSESAIITSWWDFGHFFAAVSDRGVTFDGGSQTTPQAHWVGKLLLEEDEEVAHDILKMHAQNHP
jgi:dolichyl-diphosphooligosaccharide--protein glycosyltransferase